MATMNKDALYGVASSGEYGPKDKLYNNDPGLAIGLSFPASNGLTQAVPDTSQNLKVMLVADGYNPSLLSTDGANAPLILANGSTSAGAFITFPAVRSENFAQVVFDITTIGAAPAALLAHTEVAGPSIVVLGAATPGGTLFDGSDYVLIGPLPLGSGGVGALSAFKVMPGSQYTSDFQGDKDPGSRSSQVDALQIKVPLVRRDLASAGAVSGKGASGNVYLDEMLDAFAGSLARMKDIRGGTQWDADSAKWHVDGDAYDDGKGLFHIDASLALDVPGGIKSGDGAWIDHDGLSGQIVEFEQKFSSDGAQAAGIFSAPLSWLVAYNDLKIRAHLGRLFADSHPEFVTAGSAENWFLSKVSAGTGGLTGVGGDAIAGAGVAVPGTGTHAISTDMVVPGLLRDMGTTVGGTVPEGSNAEPNGSMRNVDTNDAGSAYMQETRAAAGVKLDYMRFGYGNDSVRKLLDAGFDADSVFTDGSKKGVDIFAALVELKEAGAGSGLTNINSESIGDLQDVAAPAASGEADNGKVLKYVQVDNVQSSVAVMFTTTDSVRFTVDSSSTLAGAAGDTVNVILAQGGTSPVTAVWDASTPGSETMTITYEEGVNSINDIIAVLAGDEVTAAAETDAGNLAAAIAAGDSAIGSHDAAGGVNAIAGSWSAQADADSSHALNDLSNVSTVGQDYGHRLEYMLEDAIPASSGAEILVSVKNAANPAITSLKVDIVNGGAGYTNGAVSAISGGACVLTITLDIDGSSAVVASVIAGLVISGDQAASLEIIMLGSDGDFVAGDARSGSVLSPSWSAMPNEVMLADIMGVDLATPPTSGQVLKWNGSNFAPAADVDTTIANTNTGYDSLALGGSNVLTLSDSTAVFGNITVDLSSLAGGGGSEAHSSVELPIGFAYLEGEVPTAGGAGDILLFEAVVPGLAGNSIEVAITDSGSGGATSADFGVSVADTLTIAADLSAVDLDAIVTAVGAMASASAAAGVIRCLVNPGGDGSTIAAGIAKVATALSGGVDTISGSTDVDFGVNVHPAQGSDDVLPAFKDKMAVYLNGVRLSKNDYVLSSGGQGKLKFNAGLGAGDYVIVELKATVT